MPRKDRPELDGMELDLFDGLVALHVRYLRALRSSLCIALDAGIPTDRIETVAKLSLGHVAPPEYRSILAAFSLIASSLGKSDPS